MHLAVRDAFSARWSDAIHDEWMRNVLVNRPDLTLAQLTRTRDLMNSSVRDCLVTGQEGLIDTLTLPDAEDRHVLATAIHSQSEVIVTFNLKDFPSHRLEPFEIEAIHPDDFFAILIRHHPEVVLAAVIAQHQSLRKPPVSLPDFLATLERQGLPQTVQWLRDTMKSA